MQDTVGEELMGASGVSQGLDLRLHSGQRKNSAAALCWLGTVLQRPAAIACEAGSSCVSHNLKSSLHAVFLGLRHAHPF